MITWSALALARLAGAGLMFAALPVAAQTGGAGQQGSSPLFSAAPLDEKALAETAGRENQPTWQSAQAQSSATVEGNSIGDNSSTGAATVSDQAFQNVSGISMVNLNTGNASSINATMSVNVLIQMAPVSGAPGGM